MCVTPPPPPSCPQCTEFQMYSAYCKHRSNSETLINESTESQTFFKVQCRMQEVGSGSLNLQEVGRVEVVALICRK